MPASDAFWCTSLKFYGLWGNVLFVLTLLMILKTNTRTYQESVDV